MRAAGPPERLRQSSGRFLGEVKLQEKNLCHGLQQRLMQVAACRVCQRKCTGSEGPARHAITLTTACPLDCLLRCCCWRLGALPRWRLQPIQRAGSEATHACARASHPVNVPCRTCTHARQCTHTAATPSRGQAVLAPRRSSSTVQLARQDQRQARCSAAASMPRRMHAFPRAQLAHVAHKTTRLHRHSSSSSTASSSAGASTSSR